MIVKQYHLSRFMGGAEEQCWLLATELVRRGWDVHYASEMGKRAEPRVQDGVFLHPLPDSGGVSNGSRAAVGRLLTEVDPHVVYSRSFDAYAGYTLLEAPDHCFRIWAAAMATDGFVLRRLNEWRRLLPWMSFLRRLPAQCYALSLARRGIGRADLITAQKHDHAEDLRASGRECIVLRNWQPAVPEHKVQRHDPGQVTVLWAGSLKSWKRPEIFLELAHRCRDLDVELVMVGRAQEPRYEVLLANAGSSIPRFRYEGAVPVSEIGGVFARAHLLVCTSLSEGYPNTFIHAWLHGVGVVSLNIDPENLLSERGLGVVATTVDELEGAVRELVGDRERRLGLAQRGRAFALEEHDLVRIVDRLESILAHRGVTVPFRGPR
jgi:glycosyltransferase involved in cell wall biosynthesis